MAILSFSIDLSRSTETKSLINKICSKNVDYKDVLVRQYFRILNNIESDLYFQCIHENIPLEDLFLVKCIGDELWYVYELDKKKYSKKQLSGLIVRFLFILNHIASKQDELLISEREVTWDEEEGNPDIWNEVTYERITLPRKVYADILYDYYNFTEDRVENILNKIKVDLNSQVNYKKKGVDILNKTIQEKFKSILPDLVERLNLGVWEEKKEEDKIKIKNIRFDPIGADVDLFFRCANKALPALLRVGENLFNFVASNVKKTRFVIQYGDSNYTSNEYLDYIKDIFRVGSLKGVFKNYMIYTIPLSTPPLTIVPWQKNDGCNEARKYLLKHNFLKINRINQFISFLICKPYHYSINKKNWKKFY